jgi:hypothetical protein
MTRAICTFFERTDPAFEPPIGEASMAGATVKLNRPGNPAELARTLLSLIC